MEDPPKDAFEAAITSYNDLNIPEVAELYSNPSPLEFLRFVARNLPFVVRGGACDWAAVEKWNVDYLKDVMRDQEINVAITPLGNADSPVTLDDGKSVFVKPWEEHQNFSEFLDYLIKQENSRDQMGEVRYAQTQNDNFRGEYRALFEDVSKYIPWARIALDKSPEAINLWIGNSLSVTALHRDPYENIYVQIIGQKHFVLLPPIAHPCVGEQFLQPAHYECDASTGQLEIQLEEGDLVPFATWDPENPRSKGTIYSDLARPVVVTLEPGDMLYLPAMWFHKVSQSCSKGGICVAANYWHDMDYHGSFYSMANFVREVSHQHSDTTVREFEAASLQLQKLAILEES